VIQKGLDKQLVFYWYQDRGRIITSEYWAKIYLVLDAITQHRTDGALVRVIVPFAGDDAAVRERGKTFVAKILPLLQDYLPS
jgi:EpsI family protein